MSNANTKSRNKPSAETSNQKAMERRRQRRKNRGNSEPADWGSVQPELITQLIERVTALRGTITFGYTRDGGAYYLNYYIDNESEKVYIRPTEDIEQRLRDEYESWE